MHDLCFYRNIGYKTILAACVLLLLTKMEATAQTTISLNEYRAFKKQIDTCNEPVLSGIVTGDKKAPLRGAFVSVIHENETVAGTITDTNGRFHFCSLKPGKYKIKGEHTYYRYAIAKHTRIISDRNKQINIRLSRVNNRSRYGYECTNYFVNYNHPVLHKEQRIDIPPRTSERQEIDLRQR